MSELLILDEIMRRVQYDLKLQEIPRPCEYFDLIGGTSTGGYELCLSESDSLYAYKHYH